MAIDTGRLWRREGVAGGAVCFDHTGVLVEFVAKRFAGGESLEELAKDYALPVQTIEAGIRLVVSGAFTARRGLRTAVERDMWAQIPLLKARGR